MPHTAKELLPQSEELLPKAGSNSLSNQFLFLSVLEATNKLPEIQKALQYERCNPATSFCPSSSSSLLFHCGPLQAPSPPCKKPQFSHKVQGPGLWWGFREAEAVCYFFLGALRCGALALMLPGLGLEVTHSRGFSCRSLVTPATHRNP